MSLTEISPALTITILLVVPIVLIISYLLLAILFTRLFYIFFIDHPELQKPGDPISIKYYSVFFGLLWPASLVVFVLAKLIPTEWLFSPTHKQLKAQEDQPSSQIRSHL